MYKKKFNILIFISLLSLFFLNQTYAGRLRQKTKNLNSIKEQIQRDTKQKVLSIVENIKQTLKQENEIQTKLLTNQMKKEFKDVLDNLHNQIKNKFAQVSKKELNYELEVQKAKKLLINKNKNELDKELQKITKNKRNSGW